MLRAWNASHNCGSCRDIYAFVAWQETILGAEICDSVFDRRDAVVIDIVILFLETGL